VILGEKVRLRAIERSDIPMFVRWFNDPDLRRWISMYLPMSTAAEEQWFEGQLQDETSQMLVIETHEGMAIGNIGLFDIKPRNATAEIGISIAEAEYRGRGYGTDALRTLLRFAFDEVNLHRVYLRAYEFNERAIRSYEKSGFKREGVFRQSEFTSGRYVDMVVMGVLRSEWRQTVASDDVPAADGGMRGSP